MKLTSLLMITILALVFNGCSQCINVKPPKLIAYKCEVHSSGSYKTRNGFVLVPIKDFKAHLKQCAKCNRANAFMVKEINDYNEKIAKKD